MHPNPIFRRSDTARCLAFARERGFGVLALSSEGAPLLSHVPFAIADDDDWIELHLMRSNPIVRALSAPAQARLAVQGPDTYISPDWYEVDDQVPTWNYVAVHVTGILERRPDEELRALLDRQSAVFEARLAPKRPWMTSKMNDAALERMMRMIVPCRLSVEHVEGTWKLNQNKSDDARLRAADQVQVNGLGYETKILADMMREPWTE